MSTNKKIAIVYSVISVLMLVIAVMSIMKSHVSSFAVFVGLTFVWGSLAYLYYSKDKE